jgi:hypothetical protein
VSPVLLRTAHLLGAVLLLGNVIATGVWATIVFRHRASARDFAVAARAIWITDLVFTVGGSVLLVGAGVWRAVQLQLPLLTTPWIRDALALVLVATLLWAIWLLPAQLEMSRAAVIGDDRRLRRAFWRWSVVGWFATALLLSALVRMVWR